MRLGYFMLPISDKLNDHTIVTIKLELPDLQPGMALYQCVYEPTDSGKVVVGALESVIQVAADTTLSPVIKYYTVCFPKTEETLGLTTEEFAVIVQKFYTQLCSGDEHLVAMYRDLEPQASFAKENEWALEIAIQILEQEGNSVRKISKMAGLPLQYISRVLKHPVVWLADLGDGAW